MFRESHCSSGRYHIGGQSPVLGGCGEAENRRVEEGVVFDGTAAFVCFATTYAELESIPKDAGRM
ncbi:hypothetical protein ACMYZ5_11215 [Bacteroides sp. KG68]|uniref:hypothetical protein n=1 Tax=unclassified Bacteroides TaxID=2646097 RepID=UPI003D7F1D65